MKSTSDPLSSVPGPVWSALSRQRIYFGHQSVGDDMLAGLAAVLAQRPEVGLRIRETPGSSAIEQGVLAHTFIGENGRPESKVDHFADLLLGGLGAVVDVAMMKLCYVDVVPGVDAGALFRRYRNRMEEVRRAHSRLRLVHFTVPLTSPQRGAKAILKRLMGRSLRGYRDNHARAAYNDLVRKEFAGKELLFDLAAIESTDQQGRSVTVRISGSRCQALADEYTDDGGHLNARGQQVVAERWLLFLAELASA